MRAFGQSTWQPHPRVQPVPCERRTVMRMFPNCNAREPMRRKPPCFDPRPPQPPLQTVRTCVHLPGPKYITRNVALVMISTKMGTRA